ncbi:MAG: hydroxylamine reductase [Bacteroidales bacterium]|nr:hydroxylamine reductase [Bacteroidales bacterium]
MEGKMFCFQCQETAKGTGCTVAGVCGKKASTAALMDVLLFSVRGVATVATAMRSAGKQVPEDVAPYLEDALFATITNANFDEDMLLLKIKSGFELRNRLLFESQRLAVQVPRVEEVRWHGVPADYLRKANSCGVQRNLNPDVRSLVELTTYGLKGMAAYMSHARHLGYTDAALEAFLQRALSDLTVRDLSLDELVALVLETGHWGVVAMSLLDRANTSSYGSPQVSRVNLGVRNRPGILVSGHDLRDLEMLLKQTRDSGVDVYTHGEMLPAHYYPRLSTYPHLIGNYGSSWWHQREDFATFNGPILFTTNCIVPPFEESPYRNRIFTTNACGFRNCQHIKEDASGHKDFTPIIEMAKQCRPPQEIERGVITGGFAHDQVSQLSGKIAEAVRKGHIRKFVVMAGCDGRMPSRTYYTQFAQQLPPDCIILTAGCAKYRFNKLNLGEIDGIPRVLDAGQCNDCYSWVLTAFALRDIFHVADINQLPIVYNVAWYEQKAVIVLLALLSLGVRNIHLGPTLPAFLSPHVRDVLADRFNLGTITQVKDDLNWAA